jgi:hypothetical protein
MAATKRKEKVETTENPNKEDKVKVSLEKVDGPQSSSSSSSSPPTSTETESEETGDHDLSTTRIIIVGITLLTIATAGFYIDGHGLISDNAKGSKIVNAFYCAVMTLTTYVTYRSCSERSHE